MIQYHRSSLNAINNDPVSLDSNFEFKQTRPRVTLLLPTRTCSGRLIGRNVQIFPLPSQQNWRFHIPNKTRDIRGH